MQDRAFIANYPTRVFARETDRIQVQSRAGRTHGPILSAGTGEQYSATLANSPAVRIVDKENVREVVAPAIGEAIPRKPAVVRAHHQSISTGGPAQRLVSEVDRGETWICAHVHRQPDIAAVARRENYATFACRPAVQIIGKENGVKIRCDQRIFGTPRLAAVSRLQNRATIADYDCFGFRTKRDAGKRRVGQPFYGLPFSSTVNGDENGAARPYRNPVLRIRKGDGKKMSRCFALLLFPRLAAINGGDDRTKRAYCPTVQRILRREGHRKKMIPQTSLSQRPLLAAVAGRENHATRAANHHARLVLHVHAVKRRVSRTVLFFPLETAIVGRQYNSICSDSPTAPLVGSKADRIDRVSLW